VNSDVVGFLFLTLLNYTVFYRTFAHGALSARPNKYENLILQKAAPAVTRRKEYDQNFGHVFLDAR
jgi:hypothetical protein